MHHISLRNPFSLSRKASVKPIDPCALYRHRLLLWAVILEQNPDELLWLYRNLEVLEGGRVMQDRLSWLERRLGGLPPGLQQLVSGQPTALTAAARNPELSKEGLSSGQYPLARRFFGLQDEELHHILCFCAYGQEAQVPARAIAERIRAAADALPLRAVQ